MSKLAASPLPLLGALLLALSLRVWGLNWGLPSATHYFSYHPDESVVLETAMSMNVFAGQMLPHFYNYGSLQLYLINFANTLVFLFGGVNIVIKNLARDYGQWARMYYIGRLLTVGMGVGTVWATYALGMRLWGRRAGLFAALTLALIPLHAQHSHFLTVDVPATFWVVLSLLWSARLATADPKLLRAALLAGVFAGLATATKYNMALVFLPLVVACFVGERSPLAPNNGGTRQVYSGSPIIGGSGAIFLAAFAAFVLAFLVACPGAVLDNAKFTSDLRFEAVHVQNGDDPTFRDTGNGFVYQIARNLDAGMGLSLLLFSLVSVGYALFRRERGDGLLAAFALPYYVLISLAAVRYARYVIPLLPILALWVGRMIADWSRQPRPVLRWAVAAVSAVVFILTVANVYFLVLPMSRQDPRDEALQVVARYPTRWTVGFAAMPWFQTVPISPYFSMSQRGRWRAMTPMEIQLRIRYDDKDWDLDLLNSGKPDLVILSEYDYDDALRQKDPAALRYLQALRQGYEESFTSVPEDEDNDLVSIARIDWMPTRGLPHDMLYTNPIILIYQRRH